MDTKDNSKCLKSQTFIWLISVLVAFYCLYLTVKEVKTCGLPRRGDAASVWLGFATVVSMSEQMKRKNIPGLLTKHCWLKHKTLLKAIQKQFSNHFL